MQCADGSEPSALSLPAVAWAAPHEDPLAQLERQVVRGSQFTQAAMDVLVARLGRAEAYLTELVGLLRANGSLAEEDADGEDASGRDDTSEPAPAHDDTSEPSPVSGEEEPSTTTGVRWPGVAFRVDQEEPEQPAAEVDCDARMPICHAVCCKLNFALSPPEVEAGRVKWDLGFPYLVRHESNGYCTHNDTATGRCGIYADRPKVCRRYSCADDTRIWKDFDNMELNEEWIRENLEDQGRILVRPTLPVMEINGVATGQCGR